MRLNGGTTIRSRGGWWRGAISSAPLKLAGARRPQSWVAFGSWLLQYFFASSLDIPGLLARCCAMQSCIFFFLASVTCHEGVLHWGSFAKYASAFFRMSRSAVTFINSRFNRKISASSDFIFPLPGNGLSGS